jgi:hypothetical protein
MLNNTLGKIGRLGKQVKNDKFLLKLPHQIA